MKQLTILFADIANSTWLYQRQGDVVAHQLITECLQNLGALVKTNRGELLRTVGDSVLVSFERADDAFQAAVTMQRAYSSSDLSLRIGFHSGSVIPDKGDLYGNAVNIAARIASFAKPTEIYTSESTVQELSDAFRDSTGYLDRVDFKGVATPLAVHRIIWRPESADELPDDSGDTKIVTPKANTARYSTRYLLELRIAAKSYRIDPDNPVLTVGRAQNNDIIVDHDSTSRNHAVIEFLRGKNQFRDTSTNGSYVVWPSRSTYFLRREQAVIEDFGIIGLGWKPEPGDKQGIHFKTIAMDLV